MEIGSVKISGSYWNSTPGHMLSDLCLHSMYSMYNKLPPFQNLQSYSSRSFLCILAVAYILITSLGVGFLVNSEISFCRFGSATGPIWLDNINCLGTESWLTFCSKSAVGVNNCDHSQDVAITCSVWELQLDHGAISPNTMTPSS